MTRTRMVADALGAYRQRRDFSETGEPEGTVSEQADSGWRYAIHKHDASRLHYDLRLELDGVLKSWAVTKGPSLDPSERRLAVRTEDHPIEYADFEGTIPKGEYGGGTVMLWDSGRWKPDGDPEKGLRAGKLSFTLKGKRLSGGWALVRMDSAGDDTAENWLLIKQSDKAANRGEEPGRRFHTSVKTGRKMAEIANEKGVEAEVRVAGVRISHPNRILFEEQGVGKKALAEYYADIAERILPYVKDRPVSLLRCPRSIEDECFFQRHPQKGMSDHVKTVTVTGKEGKEDYLYVTDLKGLLSLVQLGTLEFHVWGARADDTNSPDQMIFDLDPDEALDFKAVKAAARDLRSLLQDLKLDCFIKATGGKGFHVVVPLDRRHNWSAVKAFSKAVAVRLVEEEPDKYVATPSKDKRTGKVFVDYLRNTKGASAIAPYSTRAYPEAPIACPLSWEELSRINTPRKYHIGNIRRRLGALTHDPWDDFLSLRQSLTKKSANKLSLDW